MHPILEAFEPIFGMPCWLTRRGHGSFVTMEFGQPVLDISEPRPMPLHIANAPDHTQKRLAQITGQWHLWIYLCNWSVALDGTQLAHDKSDGVTINRALGILDGQALTGLQIEPRDAKTRFAFDLGCTLSTWPNAVRTNQDEPDTQWSLISVRQPADEILAVRADGRYASGHADISHDRTDLRHHAAWRPLPAQGVRRADAQATASAATSATPSG